MRDEAAARRGLNPDTLDANDFHDRPTWLAVAGALLNSGIERCSGLHVERIRQAAAP